jgi:hypothetical protein
MANAFQSHIVRWLKIDRTGVAVPEVRISAAAGSTCGLLNQSHTRININ